jgi:diguanylate cyclase (GGDEF)-like protein
MVRAEEEKRFLGQFLDAFPRTGRELWSGLNERQVPGALLQVVQRAFDPERALVLMRRGRPGTTAWASCLVVAAAYPDDPALRVGSELIAEGNELGHVLASRRAWTREELGVESVSGRLGGARPALESFGPELWVPILVDQEAAGLLVMSAARRTRSDVRPALRLATQMASHALESAQIRAEARHSADMDGLTRVFNRRYLERALSEMLPSTAATPLSGTASVPVSVCLFDIDHFGPYNEANGHLAGDKLLQELARVVQESVRRDDVFGRFGGEEFLLVLPRTGREQALAAAAKIRSLVEGHRFPFGEGQPLGRITISGGVAQAPGDAAGAGPLLEAAGLALLQAKQQGRNRVCAAPPALEARRA